MFNELGSIYLRQDSTYIGSTPLDINIKSDWAGIIKYQQLVINPLEQFQIRVPDQPRIVYSGGVGALMIEPYSTSICPPYISENLRYTALIKKGGNRGLLYDYDTGNSGDTLINLTPQEDGEKYLDFITEGEILSQADTVIVKVFTNDENIDTTEAVVIIYPNEIDVQIIPSVISQGDTARVVLKKRGVNGLEDFAPDKVFNVEIVQGLDYGLILDSLSNDTLTTFSNIPQGFKIIAKDSTGIDSTKIRIKVSTEESEFPVARMIRNNIKTNKKEVNDDNENQKSDDEIITPDWIIPGPILLEGFGDVVVRDKYCWMLADICLDEPQPPIVFCNTYSNGAFGYDVCITEKPNIKQLGGFAAIPDKYAMNPVSLSPCFNTNLKYWRFQIHNIQLNAILDFCTSGFNNFNIIDNIAQIDLNKICDALSDLDDHSPYPLEVKPNHYLFKEVLFTHEQKHKAVYEFYCNLNYEDMISKIRAYKPTCLEIDNLIMAVDEGLNTIRPIITKQLAENISTWRWDTGKDKSDPDKEQKKIDNEEATHYSSEVQYSILNLKNELNNFYYNIYSQWPTCF